MGRAEAAPPPGGPEHPRASWPRRLRILQEIHGLVCRVVAFWFCSLAGFCRVDWFVSGTRQPTEHLVTQLVIVIVESLSRAQLFVTPWTAAPQTPLSLGLPRQESWNGLPFPPPGDLPDQGM